MAKCNRSQIQATRTVQFTVSSISFFKNGQIHARRLPLHLFLTADQCTLKITNKKNGRMGETISYETAKDEPNRPFQAVPQRVYHILSNGGNEDSLLSDYITDEESWDTITSAQMQNSVRQSVNTESTQKRITSRPSWSAFTPSRRSNGIKIAGNLRYHHLETR